MHYVQRRSVLRAWTRACMRIVCVTHRRKVASRGDKTRIVRPLILFVQLFFDHRQGVQNVLCEDLDIGRGR
jgi:hypothetical protein